MSYAGAEGQDATSYDGYCTQSDLETRIGKQVLGQLTNDNGGNEADADVVNAIIERADRFIDNKISNVYDVPFGADSTSATTTPAIVKQLSIDLSCYYAMQRRPLEFKIPDTWEQIYKDAMEELDLLQNMDDVLNDATPNNTGITIVPATDYPQADFYNRSGQSPISEF